MGIMTTDRHTRRTTQVKRDTDRRGVYRHAARRYSERNQTSVFDYAPYQEAVNYPLLVSAWVRWQALTKLSRCAIEDLIF
jgi:hypothetical protein